MSDKAAAAAKPKEKVVKAKNPKAKGPHVHYRKYIIEAIRELKERTGSSAPAISKYILEHHKQVKLAVLIRQLRLQLKRMLQERLVKKCKASFLLTDKAKKGRKSRKSKKSKTQKNKTEKKEKKPKTKTEKKDKPKKVTKPKAAKKEKPKKVAAPKKAKK
jgi:hypothetical protein